MSMLYRTVKASERLPGVGQKVNLTLWGAKHEGYWDGETFMINGYPYSIQGIEWEEPTPEQEEIETLKQNLDDCMKQKVMLGNELEIMTVLYNGIAAKYQVTETIE